MTLTMTLAAPLGDLPGQSFMPLVQGRDFTCTTRSCSSGPFKALYMSMQTRLNIFAAQLGLPGLAVDGMIGPGTVSMVRLVGLFLAGKQKKAPLWQAGDPYVALINQMASGMTKEQIAMSARVMDPMLGVAVTLLGLMQRFTGTPIPQQNPGPGNAEVTPPAAPFTPPVVTLPGPGGGTTVQQAPESHTGLIIAGVVAGTAAVGGLIYAFTRPSSGGRRRARR